MTEEVAVDSNSGIDGAQFCRQKAEEFKKQSQGSNYQQKNNVENEQTSRIPEISKTVRPENVQQLQLNL